MPRQRWPHIEKTGAHVTCKMWGAKVETMSEGMEQYSVSREAWMLKYQ
jgi:hypothetical protein